MDSSTTRLQSVSIRFLPAICIASGLFWFEDKEEELRAGTLQGKGSVSQWVVAIDKLILQTLHLKDCDHHQSVVKGLENYMRQGNKVQNIVSSGLKASVYVPIF